MGELVDGRLVLTPEMRGPQPQDAGPSAFAAAEEAISREDLEFELREEYDRHPDYNDEEYGGGTFEDMVILFSGEPRYSLHEYAKRLLALTLKN